MDFTSKLVDDLFAMKMFHCAHCKDVLQTPVMLVENIGNVCHSCYDNMKGEDNLVALENTFVNTLLEKVKIPCENESKGCSERVPYKEIQEHKQQCIYQSFHCIAPEECSWTGCLKDFEIHHRETHKSYHLRSQNNHFPLGTSLGALREGVYLLQTLCGDFFLSVNKTNQDVAFFICDIGQSADDDDDDEYNFSVTFSDKRGRKFSCDMEFIPWESFITANNVELYNKTKISLECLNNIFQDDSIEILLNLCIEYSPGVYVTDDRILKYFQCRNCKSYLKSEVYSCLKTGKYFCGSCKDLKCHSTDTCRFLPLEKLLRKVLLPCKFKNKGCLAKIWVDDSDHELSCPYRDFECISCEFTGSRLLLINHLEQRHNCRPSIVTLTEKDTKRLVSYLTRDNLLFQVSHENSFPNSLTWTVDILGYTEEDYCYQIKVTFGSVNMTFVAPCARGRTRYSMVKLTPDLLQHVGYDGSSLQYVIQILKC